jgi:AcrR family transcriptional regulator
VDQNVAGNGRRPGRPRREIDMAALAEAVERLFADGGYEAVSVERAARELSVSRATLYRTVGSKDQLLAVLFERITRQLRAAADQVVTAIELSARDRLFHLVSIHIAAAVETRGFFHAVFGAGPMPAGFDARWRRWRRDYEALWTRAVGDAMEDGTVAPGDPVVTSRLLLGMCIWVARWYRPEEGRSAGDIARSALDLLAGPPTAVRGTASATTR